MLRDSSEVLSEMTNEEFAEEMRKTFEYSRTMWLVVMDGNEKTSRAIFYLAALRKIEREPFDNSFKTEAVKAYLNEKLGEAFEKLSPTEIEDVFEALEELGLLRSKNEVS
jgi:hypothetical protein